MKEGPAGSSSPIDDLLREKLVVFAVVCPRIADDVHEARPASTDANHTVALVEGPKGDGADGGVQSWDIASPRKDCDGG